jgi:predicted DNA-binding transcriptional regulator AlpA
MILKLIDKSVLADYLKAHQSLIEEIIRDQQHQEQRSGKPPQNEQMLMAKEAAKILACSEDWLYRNAKKLPFARKLGPKNLRFSKSGLEKWLASRQVN